VWGEVWVILNRDVMFDVEVDVSRNMMNSRMGYFWISDHDLFWWVFGVWMDCADERYVYFDLEAMLA